MAQKLLIIQANTVLKDDCFEEFKANIMKQVNEGLLICDMKLTIYSFDFKEEN